MKRATQSSQGHTSFMCSSNVKLLVLQSTEGEESRLRELKWFQVTTIFSQEFRVVTCFNWTTLSGITWLNRIRPTQFHFLHTPKPAVLLTHTLQPSLLKTKPAPMLFSSCLFVRPSSFLKEEIFERSGFFIHQNFFGRSGQTSLRDQDRQERTASEIRTDQLREIRTDQLRDQDRPAEGRRTSWEITTEAHPPYTCASSSSLQKKQNPPRCCSRLVMSCCKEWTSNFT